MKATVKSHSYGKQHTGVFEGNYFARDKSTSHIHRFVRINIINENMIIDHVIRLDTYEEENVRIDMGLRSTLSDLAQEVLFQTHKPNFRGSWVLISSEEFHKALVRAMDHLNIVSQDLGGLKKG